MTCSVLVVGMPSPEGCDSTKTWKAAANLVEQRLAHRFGPAVTFEYAELFGVNMAGHLDVEAQIAAGEAAPPIVIVDGVRRFAGGKLNLSAIERAVADALASSESPTAFPTISPEKDAPHV